MFLSQVTEAWWVFLLALIDQASDFHSELPVRKVLGNQVIGTTRQIAVANLVVIQGHDTEEWDQSPVAGALVKQSTPICMTGHEVEEGGIGGTLGEHLLRLGKGCGSFDFNAWWGHLCHSPSQKFGSIYHKNSGHVRPPALTHCKYCSRLVYTG